MTKQEILAEIRRTAEANGSRPLGRERFARETGIRETDWYGRYWATWSEAVAEAEYVPNSLNAAYPEDLLLRKYAELTRRLRRLPRAVDLRLARREDPGFPSHNVYVRFGSKAELVSKLLSFCREHAEFGDLVTLCAARGEPGRLERPSATETFGFVYLLTSGRYYKIGKSNAAGRREREVALQLPERVQTLHVIRTDDPAGIEAYWHSRFASKRVRGEWFALEAADVSTFRRRKFM